MGIPPLASAVAETKKMKAFSNVFRDRSPEGSLFSYPDTSCCDTRKAILNIEGIKGSLKMN
jgi:hypothetical protein